MKKRLGAAFLALLLLLSACSAPAAEGEDAALHILCTTYPVYLLTTAVTQGAEGVQVDLLVNAQTSCLHDYTLTVKDMKAIEGADVIVMNGVGLEEFMDDALAQTQAAVIDCSADIELLPLLEDHSHGDHDHDAEYDPHIWMDPLLAAEMLENIAAGLTQRTGRDLREPCLEAKEALEGAYGDWKVRLEPLSGAGFITFHDGFQYFARSFGLDLLKAIEEEEGSTASAAEIKEVSALIGAWGVPAIFTEKNGSEATAKAIGRETGCGVYELDMLMSGEGSGIGAYIEAMEADIQTILEALG